MYCSSGDVSRVHLIEGAGTLYSGRLALARRSRVRAHKGMHQTYVPHSNDTTVSGKG